MIRRLTTILVLAAGLLVAGDAFADYGRRIDGKLVEERTKKVLTDVKWHGDIDAALSDAKQQKKPMLFLQMVGDLDGGL